MIKSLHKYLWKPLPVGIRKIIHRNLPKAYKKSLKQSVINDLSDAIVISFPKCGRTWLRVLLGKLLKQHFNIKSDEVLEIHRLADKDNRVPRIYFSHDDNPHKKSPNDLNTDKSTYKNQKIIFLVRDPRDVLVSIYHHKTFRTEEFEGSIRDYFNQEVGSLESIINFYNIWDDNKNKVQDFLIIQYESLHTKPVEEIRKILDFLNIKKVENTKINNAIEFASFSNMRKIEKSGEAKNDKLTTKEGSSEKALKTRSGKVGEYK